MDFVLVVICADHFSFCLPVTSLTNLRDSAATPRSQEMSQDAPGTPTTFVMAATLTSEADLKAWYLANNPTLRSHGLSCQKALYKEMKRDLRGRFRTTVAIVPAIDEEDMKRLIDEFFVKSNATPNQATCRVRQMCPNAPIFVLTSTSNEELSHY